MQFFSFFFLRSILWLDQLFSMKSDHRPEDGIAPGISEGL